MTAELDDAVGRRYVDGKQLRQVLINLVQNAYQAQPNGGETVVSTRVGEGKVFIDVADRAPVVPPADRDKLFMPFFTTKDGGSGLGLTISQRIVEAHGGTIQCLPRPGGGNRFVVELPAEAEG
ncbi:MAG: ATP-binding protein [Deltaproteobacteria bacterium]|nr:ATP-binding protein [Deltaproteobacteria bacterium]